MYRGMSRRPEVVLESKAILPMMTLLAKAETSHVIIATTRLKVNSVFIRVDRRLTEATKSRRDREGCYGSEEEEESTAEEEKQQ